MRTLAQSTVFLSVVSSIQFVCPSFVFRAHSCCVTHWTRHRHGSRHSKVQKSSCLSHPYQRVFSSRHLSSFIQLSSVFLRVFFIFLHFLFFASFFLHFSFSFSFFFEFLFLQFFLFFCFPFISSSSSCSFFLFPVV